MRPINLLVWHCSATPENKPFTAADIDRWHKAQGWAGIGYHYVVLLDGTVQKGRPVEKVGAHVQGHNTGSIGCVYIGGVAADGKTPKDTRTPAQKEAMMQLTKDLLKQFPTIKRIAGHNEFSSKACPSFKVPDDPLGKLL
ncbi:N-acetylmuramoyl-L-alanine amidase [Brucella sp. 10RB9210]|uniref:N-acetylmuramoyl-L-alanine amidase n=1 Tax=Brucella sp. 10RB9210 TaxID=1844037 RepID=UPI0012AE0260|nr:N-acetylmuramoyl-L-alanine amidase [Brucella sp. 10RB9210]MRN79461.1 N-acetylmuramoyl-L-alanine amidase [Brucella sp. 10RB9210]